MQFVASATLPDNNQGKLQWEQLLNNDRYQYLVSPGAVHSVENIDQPPELDTSHPYGVDGNGDPITSCNQGPGSPNPATVYTTNLPCDTAIDSPGFALPYQYSELQGYFSATMFLEWVPIADGICTANNQSANPCIIPAPLGSINWHWTGDAIDTLQKNASGFQTWEMNLNCSNGTPCPVVSPFQLGGPLPTWSKRSH